MGPGAAMGGMGGARMGRRPDREPAGTLKGDITIKRVAYFAVDEEPLHRNEDTMNKKINKILLPEMETAMGAWAAWAAWAAWVGWAGWPR